MNAKQLLALSLLLLLSRENPLAQQGPMNIGISKAVESEAGAGTDLPVGSIILIKSGTCAAGWQEDTSLAGVVPFGTLAANADIGATGGNDNVTPAGTVSTPTFVGSALGTHLHGVGTYVPSAHSGAAVADHSSHTHTYTDVVNHTHTINITDPGHTHTQNVNSATNGGLNGYGVDTSTNTSTASGYSTASATTGVTAASVNPGGGVATGTTAGPSATLTHNVTQPSAHTMSGSSEAVGAGTPAGTVSQPTFTGSSLDNRQAFIKVIFCRKV